MIDVVRDMETGDPDDFLTLLLPAGHPAVRLRAVTVTPGTPDQIGLVRWALRRLDHDEIPVGAFDLAATSAASRRGTTRPSARSRTRATPGLPSRCCWRRATPTPR
jgi:pyrimidine-specific ribonucleoside hydrolase